MDATEESKNYQLSDNDFGESETPNKNLLNQQKFAKLSQIKNNFCPYNIVCYEKLYGFVLLQSNAKKVTSAKLFKFFTKN